MVAYSRHPNILLTLWPRDKRLPSAFAHQIAVDIPRSKRRIPSFKQRLVFLFPINSYKYWWYLNGDHHAFRVLTAPQQQQSLKVAKSGLISHMLKLRLVSTHFLKQP
ncbi:hypothetical protein GWI33_005736 [Rhynchophorus ferrugineus]|uniref:Uncharacterized protein n=1 Tax=Rhynchophorus ferrugineus TaxID=354439 RepID=A0A834IL80_RHYFE|nr:hypothetical protein GWI33_005736 [Rhynchophorus ferrugineus]